jgi:hypothetical protein
MNNKKHRRCMVEVKAAPEELSKECLQNSTW